MVCWKIKTKASVPAQYIPLAGHLTFNKHEAIFRERDWQQVLRAVTLKGEFFHISVWISPHCFANMLVAVLEKTLPEVVLRGSAEGRSPVSRTMVVVAKLRRARLHVVCQCTERISRSGESGRYDHRIKPFLNSTSIFWVSSNSVFEQITFIVHFPYLTVKATCIPGVS